MGEIPIFTSKAHVFVIDPETKKSWIPASKSLVQVNFFFDSSRNSYRIISVDGSKAIINSTVVPEMSFTKTSGKFGQWADIQAGIVYGLGFGTDSQLATFCEQFETIREKSQNLRSHLSKTEKTNEATGKEKINSSNMRPGLSPDALSNNKEADNDVRFSSPDVHPCFRDNSHQLRTLRPAKRWRRRNVSFNLLKASDSAEHHHEANPEMTDFRSQSLKECHEENNESELDTLKLANKKLTSTLQDTMASANEWLKKMNSFKDDCDVKQTRINALEEEKKRLSQTIDELAQKNKSLLKKNKEICQECSLLQQRIEVLSVMEAQHDQCAVRIKSCLEENEQIEEEKRRMEEKLEQAAIQRKSDVTEVRKCCAEIAAHLTVITETTQKLQSTI